MAIKTQGSQLFAIDPSDDSVLTIDCVISIDGIDTTLEQIETTCLEAAARTYVAGLATPSTATFGINVDPSSASHVRLHQLKVAGTDLKWALGWSDGPLDSSGSPTALPTVDSSGDFDLPTSRSWIAFEGFMNSYPFSFAQNAVVTSNVGIQISGEPVFIPKV